MLGQIAVSLGECPVTLGTEGPLISSMKFDFINNKAPMSKIWDVTLMLHRVFLVNLRFILFYVHVFNKSGQTG